MLCQHSLTTEGGNGTISLLTGKSCHSPTKLHNSFPLKMDGALFTAFALITDGKATHAIWIRAGLRAWVRSYTSRHAQTDSCKQSNSGVCLCWNTECEQLLDGRRGGNLAAGQTGIRRNTHTEEGESVEVNIEQDRRQCSSGLPYSLQLNSTLFSNHLALSSPPYSYLSHSLSLTFSSSHCCL